jgi:hypothetical protein
MIAPLPPTGLAIAAILLWDNRITPAIFVAAFLINQVIAGSVFTYYLEVSLTGLKNGEQQGLSPLRFPTNEDRPLR